LTAQRLILLVNDLISRITVDIAPGINNGVAGFRLLGAATGRNFLLISFQVKDILKNKSWHWM
jgi:precorrin-3B methylase